MVLCVLVAGFFQEASSNKTTEQSSKGRLRSAVYSGEKELVIAYLERGADVNEHSFVNMTPLHFAAMFGHNEIAKILLDHGADVHVRSFLNSTPLIEARRHGHDELAKLLCLHGATE